ncbi:hypothetical protein CEUSTIGMA_g7685.t1 [Chlamydomonas eustigma]|uniref:Myb-like domain-containing protein n=1 Tax=Chlamydomonas eustigma TaxID=1157962 RepID=A0A250XAY7_9CHLO|nr:hypothetical protein CEUSTIGMA_g7685.t1 [Chlamydomonas eustigma]|eukprot:GAX80247.1 hypothetical protein CEUSTIGMA_g7685.t1 [Chlamydomonas eustigma]
MPETVDIDRAGGVEEDEEDGEFVIDEIPDTESSSSEDDDDGDDESLQNSRSPPSLEANPARDIDYQTLAEENYDNLSFEEEILPDTEDDEEDEEEEDGGVDHEIVENMQERQRQNEGQLGERPSAAVTYHTPAAIFRNMQQQPFGSEGVFKQGSHYHTAGGLAMASVYNEADSRSQQAWLLDLISGTGGMSHQQLPQGGTISADKPVASHAAALTMPHMIFPMMMSPPRLFLGGNRIEHEAGLPNDDSTLLDLIGMGSPDVQAGTTAAAASGGICRRTRAHLSLKDTSIDELERALCEEVVDGEVEAVEEKDLWEEFLQGLTNNGEEALLPEEDEEDSEFDVSELMKELEDAEEEDAASVHDDEHMHGVVVGGSGATEGLGDGLTSTQDDSRRDPNIRNERRVTRATARRRMEAQVLGAIRLKPPSPPPSIVDGSATNGAANQGRVAVSVGGVSRLVIRGLDALQLQQLYEQVYLHSQMVIQLYAMTAKDPCPEAQQIAEKARNMLLQLNQSSWAARESSLAEGLPAYTPDQLGMPSSSGNTLGTILPVPPSAFNLRARVQPYPAADQVHHLQVQQEEEARRVALSQLEALMELKREREAADNPAGGAGGSLLGLLGSSSFGARGLLADGSMRLTGLLGASNQVRDVVYSGNIHAIPSTSSCLPLGAAAAAASPDSGSVWAPTLVGDVRSVLDVAPLRLLPALFSVVDVLSAIPLHESPMQEIIDMDAVNAKERKKARKGKKGKEGLERAVEWVSPALNLLQPFLNPRLAYRPAARVPRNYWSPGEDELLAMGIRRLGTNYALLQEIYFPSRTKDQLWIRQKNILARKKTEAAGVAVDGSTTAVPGGVGGGTLAVLDAKNVVMGPLNLEEIALVRRGLQCMGMNPIMAGLKGSTPKIVWERISSDLVPLRRGDTLRKLWREVTANGTRDPIATSAWYHAATGEQTADLANTTTHNGTEPAGLDSSTLQHGEEVGPLQDAREHLHAATVLQNGGVRRPVGAGILGEEDSHGAVGADGDAQVVVSGHTQQAQPSSEALLRPAASLKPDVNTLLSSHLTHLGNIQAYRKVAQAKRARESEAAAQQELGPAENLERLITRIQNSDENASPIDLLAALSALQQQQENEAAQKQQPAKKRRRYKTTETSYHNGGTEAAASRGAGRSRRLKPSDDRIPVLPGIQTADPMFQEAIQYDYTYDESIIQHADTVMQGANTMHVDPMHPSLPWAGPQQQMLNLNLLQRLATGSDNAGAAVSRDACFAPAGAARVVAAESCTTPIMLDEGTRSRDAAPSMYGQGFDWTSLLGQPGWAGSLLESPPCAAALNTRHQLLFDPANVQPSVNHNSLLESVLAGVHSNHQQQQLHSTGGSVLAGGHSNHQQQQLHSTGGSVLAGGHSNHQQQQLHSTGGPGLPRGREAVQTSDAPVQATVRGEKQQQVSGSAFIQALVEAAAVTEPCSDGRHHGTAVQVGPAEPARARLPYMQGIFVDGSGGHRRDYLPGSTSLITSLVPPLGSSSTVYLPHAPPLLTQPNVPSALAVPPSLHTAHTNMPRRPLQPSDPPIDHPSARPLETPNYSYTASALSNLSVSNQVGPGTSGLGAAGHSTSAPGTSGLGAAGHGTSAPGTSGLGAAGHCTSAPGATGPSQVWGGIVMDQLHDRPHRPPSFPLQMTVSEPHLPLIGTLNGMPVERRSWEEGVAAGILLHSQLMASAMPGGTVAAGSRQHLSAAAGASLAAAAIGSGLLDAARRPLFPSLGASVDAARTSTLVGSPAAAAAGSGGLDFIEDHLPSSASQSPQASYYDRGSPWRAGMLTREAASAALLELLGHHDLQSLLPPHQTAVHTSQLPHGGTAAAAAPGSQLLLPSCPPESPHHVISRFAAAALQLQQPGGGDQAAACSEQEQQLQQMAFSQQEQAPLHTVERGAAYPAAGGGGVSSSWSKAHDRIILRTVIEQGSIGPSTYEAILSNLMASTSASPAVAPPCYEVPSSSVNNSHPLEEPQDREEAMIDMSSSARDDGGVHVGGSVTQLQSSATNITTAATPTRQRLTFNLRAVIERCAQLFSKASSMVMMQQQGSRRANIAGGGPSCSNTTSNDKC